MSFDLADIGKSLAKLGLPLLGAALPVPGGAAIGMALAKAIGSPSESMEDIVNTIAGDPEALRLAKEFELKHEETILRITSEHEIAMRKQDSADISTVNETMRTELEYSKDEVWYQKAWRPACGFAVAAGSFMAVWFVCNLFYKAIVTPTLGLNVTTVVGSIPQLATAVAMILGVPGAAVGIASWHRGKQKREATSGSTKEG